MVNKAFVNYLDQFDKVIDSLEHPNPTILMDETTFQQILLIYLNISKFDSALLTHHRLS